MEPRQTNRAAWLLAAAGAAAAALLAWGALRLAVLTTIVLIAPGLAFTFALLPRGRLRLSERLLVAVGVGLGIAVLVAAALVEAPLVFDRTSLVLVLAAVAIVAALVGVLRLLLGDRVESERPRPAAGRRRSFRVGAVEGIVLLAAVALAAVTVASARIPVPADGVRGHTLLWALPDAQGRRWVEVGVESQEFDRARFRLAVATDAGADVAYHIIVLGPKERWQGWVRVPTGASRVEARLLREGVSGVYRRVLLHVPGAT